MATDNVIVLKGLGTAAGVPQEITGGHASGLVVGELAVNTAASAVANRGHVFLGVSHTTGDVTANIDVGDPTTSEYRADQEGGIVWVGAPILNEDNMASDSDVHIATQQSVKAYVDTATASTRDIDALGALGGTGVAQGDYFLISDGGTEKKITASNLEDWIFGNVSSDITVAAGGAASIGATKVTGAMLNDDAISGQGAIGAAPANSDELLLSDGGVLKSLTIANLAANSSFASGVPTTITVADESSDTTCFPMFATAVTGDLGPKTGTNLTFNSSSGALGATSFSGNLSGSDIASGTVAAARVATLNQDTSGTAGIATTVTLTDEGSDTTCFPVFAQTATGNIAMETDASALTYNSGTGSLASTTFVGALTGQSSTVATIAGLAPNTATTAAAQGNITSLGTLTGLSMTGDLNMEDSDKIVMGVGNDVEIYHDGSNTYFKNAVGALKLATETSGIAVTIGHGTSEVTVADNLTVTGDLTVSGATTSVNTATLDVVDLNITVGKNATTSSAANGAGLTFGAWSSGTIPTLTWDHSNTRFAMNKDLAVDIVGDVTGALTGNASGTALSVTQAAQSAITSLGTLTTLQVDNVNINGSAITGSTAADLVINVTDGQSVVVEGLDIDDGVVTGASSITSTAFVGNITGALTGNASGTALSVTQAAQSAITSLGTLTTLQVDNVNINGSAITGSTAADLVINVTDGQSVVVEGLDIDDGVVTGASSITSTTFVGALTGQAATVATIAGLAPNTATTQATQGAITSAANLVTVGTIGTGVWQGTKVASAYLDDETVHLTTAQTLTNKTIAGGSYTAA